MKKISAILFFSITLLFSSATMAQNSPWVGKWDLQIQADVRTVFATLKIEFEGNNLAGTIEFEGNETPQVIDHFNDSDTELILGFKMEDSDDLIFPLTLRKKVDGMISGSFESKNGAGEQILLNVIVEKVSDDSDGDLAQISNPWVGEWELDFKNIDDKETNFIAKLSIDYVNGKLEGKIVYYYQDDTEEEAVIEHFNDSDTELILGFKVEGSDDLYFPLTLRFEDKETIERMGYDVVNGTWEDKEASYTVVGGRR